MHLHLGRVRHDGAAGHGALRAWFRLPAVALLLFLGGCAGNSPDPAAVAALSEHRAALRQTWDDLLEADLTGLERVASFVQAVADRNVERLGSDAPAAAWKRAVLDDLADLMVPDWRWPAVRAFMLSPRVYRGPIVHEGESGLEGFADAFRPGEGRLRHFAASAVASYALPGLAVEVGGRWLGGDFTPQSGTDEAADVRANSVGRAFAAWLAAASAETLADGTSVASWVRERFGAGVP